MFKPWNQGCVKAGYFHSESLGYQVDLWIDPQGSNYDIRIMTDKSYLKFRKKTPVDIKLYVNDDVAHRFFGDDWFANRKYRDMPIEIMP